MIKKHFNILITSAGRRVELIKCFKLSIEKLPNVVCKIITVDKNPELSAACQVSDNYFKVVNCDHPNYVKDILNLCLENNIKIIIPTIDTELVVLAKVRNDFEKRGIFIIVSDLDFVQNCRDKRLLDSILFSKGIRTPKIFEKNSLKFPFFLKPFNGSNSVGAKRINSIEEISLKELNDKRNIFQELIPDSWQEYSVDMYFNRENKLMACTPRKRLAIRGGEISKGVLKKNFIYDYLKIKIKDLKGARGIITMQLFTEINNRNIICIEINPRFGGGYPMSYFSGFDVPKLIIKEYLFNEKINFLDSWTPDKVMLRYDSMIIKN